MTALAALESAAWLLVASGIGTLSWAATGQLIETRVELGNVEREPAKPYRALQSPDSLRGVIEARNIFRIERNPDPSAYDPLHAGAYDEQPVVHDWPLLTLVGIVDGRTPLAIITGFPGVERARVVAEGDVISDLSVQSIRDGEVHIAGMDTVWVLRVKEEWGGGSD